MVEVRNISMEYGTVLAVNDVTVEVNTGEFVTLLGPSGCGKTTTLRSIAGLETPSVGVIRVGGQVMCEGGMTVVPAEKRGIGMVFQSYAIWPHMSVFDNVAYSLKLRKRPRTEIRKTVDRVLDLVGLAEFSNRPGTNLSGGQQQRVALGRALAMEPKLLLLDEPLSNLDAKLRERMRSELKRIQAALGITTVYVTHDQTEALAMSDRVYLMKDGKVVQSGSPRELYEEPAHEFAARFIGSCNLLSASIVGDVRADRHVTYELSTGQRVLGRLRTNQVGGQYLIAVRPEQVKVQAERPTDVNVFEGTISSITYLGPRVECVVDIGKQEISAEVPTTPVFRTGDRVWISMDPQAVNGFVEEEQGGSIAAQDRVSHRAGESSGVSYGA